MQRVKAEKERRRERASTEREGARAREKTKERERERERDRLIESCFTPEVAPRPCVDSPWQLPLALMLFLPTHMPPSLSAQAGVRRRISCEQGWAGGGKEKRVKRGRG